MRKLFFSALACVAFAGSAFASNEVVIEKENGVKIEREVELFKEGIIILNDENNSDDYKVCVTVVEVNIMINCKINVKTRRICSNHHTEKELKESLEGLGYYVE